MAAVPHTEVAELDALEGNDSGEDALTQIFEAIEAGVTGLPAPVRKNFMKVAAQLCTAVMDIPVAMLEGKAAEIRAASTGRVKLIGTSSNQLAAQMKVDSEYVKVAAHKFTQKVVREQINLDKTTAVAYEELKIAPGSAEPVADISEDFLNVFEREVSQMSTEKMQRMFGKILAGEIQKPSTFSIKAIKQAAQLDNQAASTFRLLCSLTCSLKIGNHSLDARVISFGTNAGSNSLSEYGLSFDALNMLQEYGLIISDYNSRMNFRLAILIDNKIGIPLTYQNQQYGLAAKVHINAPVEFNVDGISLSRTGKELLNVMEIQPNEAYTAALIKYFDTQGYEFRKITMTTPPTI